MVLHLCLQMAPDYVGEGSQLAITHTPVACSQDMSNMYCTKSIKVDFTYDNGEQEAATHTVIIDDASVSITY